MKTTLCAAAVLFTVSAANLQASTLNLIAFGDSLLDSGNVDIALQAGGSGLPDIYPNGQFTNGDSWATQLGLAPSLAGGTNFGFGGARAAPNDDGVPDLQAQVRAFRNSGETVNANTTAAIWVGGNDFLAVEPDAPLLEVKRTVTHVVENIRRGVRTLYKSGVGNIIVLGLPDFGLLPQNADNPQFATAASTLTAQFNAGLALTLEQLDAGLPHSDIRFFDVNGLFQEVLSQVPAELTSVPCLRDPAGCAIAPENYVFYDDIHPSEWVHARLALAISEEIQGSVSEVPLPATAPLLLAGLGGLGLCVRRRKSRA